MLANLFLPFVTQTCPESSRNIREAFKTSLKTTATLTTSQLKRVVDAPDEYAYPGLHTSIHAGILVNGEGSETAQLVANRTLVEKVAKAVMIELKDNLPHRAVAQIDDITLALHTKAGHENGATSFPTMSPVRPEQVGYYTYVDVDSSVWDTKPLSRGDAIDPSYAHQYSGEVLCCGSGDGHPQWVQSWQG